MLIHIPAPARGNGRFLRFWPSKKWTSPRRIGWQKWMTKAETTWQPAMILGQDPGFLSYGSWGRGCSHWGQHSRFGGWYIQKMWFMVMSCNVQRVLGLFWGFSKDRFRWVFRGSIHHFSHWFEKTIWPHSGLSEKTVQSTRSNYPQDHPKSINRKSKISVLTRGPWGRDPHGLRPETMTHQTDLSLDVDWASKMNRSTTFRY